MAEASKAEAKRLSITEDELNELLARREKDAKMPKEEKQLRGIIREEIAGALGEFFTFSDEGDDDEGSSGGDNDGGFAGVAKLLGLGGAS